MRGCGPLGRVPEATSAMLHHLREGAPETRERLFPLARLDAPKDAGFHVRLEQLRSDRVHCLLERQDLHEHGVTLLCSASIFSTPRTCPSRRESRL